jgi:hypothetical protein
MLVIVILGVGFGLLKSVTGWGEKRLEIVAAANLVMDGSTNRDGAWLLTGRVLFDGEPQASSTLWAIITDDRGNRFSPPAKELGRLGEFRIDNIPMVLSGTNKPKTLEATIYAKAVVQTQNTEAKETLIKGKETLTLGEHGGIRWVELPWWAIFPLILIFLGSLVIAVIRFATNSIGMKIKYYSSVVLALLLTVWMIGCISAGLRKINLMESKSDVITLGFANIFHGTYEKNTQPEWLLSLTAPTAPAADRAELVRGFGTPLWVLFISVLGGGAFTLMILINGIKTPVDFTNDTKVNEAVESIVRHQFYILFAPVGAAFVYQLMVAAGMTAQPVTVATVALAAGVAINFLLNMALEGLTQLMDRGKNASDPNAPAAGNAPAAANTAVPLQPTT